MDETRREAFRMLLSSQTRHPVDRQRAIIALQAAQPSEIDEVRRMILDRRMYWLDWLTVTQREWQTKVSKRPQKAKHHDTMAIRERYVRAIA